MPLLPPLPRVSPLPVKSMTAQNWVPVSYTSTVTGLTAGQTLMMPQVTLQSGFNTPYFVDEIRFTAFTAAADTTSSRSTDIASFLSFQLQTGHFYFSQSALGSPSSVPMNMYAPTFSTNAQWESVFGVKSSSTAGSLYATRRWLLPKPLWMPPGDIIQATITRDVAVGSSLSNITAQMTVIGRALPPHSAKPVARCVPHVGWFLHPISTTHSAATQQLRNPFKVPWNVQRLILESRATFDANFNTNSLGGYGFFESPDASQSYFQIRISDSLGYKVTGSSLGGYVPLGDVAAAINDGAWTFSRPLPVDQNFNVDFNFIGGGSLTSSKLQPMISFVGYREETP